MPWGDVRGLLQYVPQFRGKVFVIVIDTPVSVLAETMLDLVALQDIGVRLVMGSMVHSTDDLLDRAAEVELKFAQSAVEPASDPEETLTGLNRGQAVVLDLAGRNAFSMELASFARALGAVKLVLLQTAGETLPLGAIRAAEVNQEHSDILQSAASVCDAGIPRVHVLDGSNPAALLSELFSNEGVGAMVYADSYRVVRPLREEDIVELLGMIGRSVRKSRLVPRDYADIERRLDEYSVMEIDGNVVGNVALHRYDDCANMGEIACLYVKQDHEGLGYGIELVHHAEQQARDLGLESVFALTNRAAGFFQTQLGYSEASPDEIPASRRDQLLASGRDSRVFRKVL